MALLDFFLVRIFVERVVDFVEEGSVLVVRHRSLSPSSTAPTRRMRNSCKRAGRTPRPDGSFLRAVGPTRTYPIDELLGALPELCRRAEGIGALELDEGLVALCRPREQQAEVE